MVNFSKILNFFSKIRLLLKISLSKIQGLNFFQNEILQSNKGNLTFMAYFPSDFQ